MGNSGSAAALSLRSAAASMSSVSIRILLSDGSLQLLSAPIPASHLHLHPNFLLCDSLSLRVGSRPCPLRPDSRLLFGHLYIVLPLSAFQRRLSWSYLSAIASTFAASDAHLRRSQRRQQRRRKSAAPPPQLLSCASRGVVNVCDSDEALSRYIDQLIERSNSWQPKLDTIDETSAAAAAAAAATGGSAK